MLNPLINSACPAVAVFSVCALTACTPGTSTSDGSGTTEATSDGSTTQTSTQTTGDTTEEATTDDSGSETEQGTDTTTDATSDSSDSETDGTTGTNSCPQTEEFACSQYEIDCEQVDCGGLNSPFDENGCLRDTCNGGPSCGEGMECYTPLDWGGCASSGLFCNDSELQMACICGGDADCNGSYCVPHELYPVTEFGGGPGRFDNSCAPDDGPAHELVLGLDQQTCDGILAGESLRIIIHSGNFGLGFGPMPPDVYDLEGNGFVFYDNGMDPPESSDVGFVEIDAWDATVTGSYKVWVGDKVFVGEFSDIPYCDGNPMCG